MSFRRTKAKAIEKLRWEDFRDANTSAIVASGLPSDYVEDLAMFDDFLMHGCIDHHSDRIRFSSDQMSGEQRSALVQLIRAYLAAGFENPGIACLHWDELQDLRRQLPDAV